MGGAGAAGGTAAGAAGGEAGTPGDGPSWGNWRHRVKAMQAKREAARVESRRGAYNPDINSWPFLPRHGTKIPRELLPRTPGDLESPRKYKNPLYRGGELQDYDVIAAAPERRALESPEGPNTINDTVDSNSNIPFVNRIKNKDKYPTLTNEKGYKGMEQSESTHSMASTDVNGTGYSYPTVVFDGEKMVRLGDDEAWEHAVKTDNILQFGNKDEADYFSKHYKEYWDKPKKKNKWTEVNVK